MKRVGELIANTTFRNVRMRDEFCFTLNPWDVNNSILCRKFRKESQFPCAFAGNQPQHKKLWALNKMLFLRGWLNNFSCKIVFGHLLAVHFCKSKRLFFSFHFCCMSKRFYLCLACFNIMIKVLLCRMEWVDRIFNSLQILISNHRSISGPL